MYKGALYFYLYPEFCPHLCKHVGHNLKTFRLKIQEEKQQNYLEYATPEHRLFLNLIGGIPL
jgi:hypothetical protein